MISLHKLALTFALATAFALAGCASDDEDPTGTGTTGSGTTGTGTTGTGTGTSTGTGGPGPGGNGTIEDRTCTAVAGGSGSGWANVGGNYVGGCPFGDATTTATLVVSADLPADCDLYQAPASDNLNAQPASVGSEYPADTIFSMFCGPGGVQLEGTIQLQAV